jgi:hypothetical protein
MAAIAQIVAANDADKSAAWETLRFFVYSSVVTNLTSAAISLIVLEIFSFSSTDAQWCALNSSKSWPFRIAQGELLPMHILQADGQLLQQFGIGSHYNIGRFIQISIIWRFAGIILSIVGIWLWICLTASKVIVAAMSVVIFPAVLTFFYYIYCVIFG